MCTFCLNTSVFGQIKPDIIPEDFITEETHVTCHCKPGVRNKSRSKGLELTFGRLGGGTFISDENGSDELSDYSSLNQFGVNLKFPVVNKDALKILLGYKYFSERFNFDDVGVPFQETFQRLDDARLKSNSISVIVSKPLNETKYLAFRLRYSTNGDYNSFIAFEGRYSIYKFLGIYGIKPNDDFEWGVGLSINRSFRNNNVLPFVVYNRTFSDRWGIEAILPASVYMRCNFNPDLILLMGANFNSSSYRIDTEDDFPNNQLSYAFNHSEILPGVELEYKISNWVWANLNLGYQINLSSDFDSRNDNTPFFTADPTNSVFFRVGVFLSPPDHFGDKDDKKHDHDHNHNH